MKEGVLTLHLPSSTTTSLTAELLGALSSSKEASVGAGSASDNRNICKPPSISDLISSVAAGTALVVPESWRVVQVENVWCTVCDMTMPQMPLRTHLPMTEMQVGGCWGPGGGRQDQECVKHNKKINRDKYIAKPAV